MTDPAAKTDPWKEYDADARRIVSMLQAVAKLDGRMKARRSLQTKNEIVRETGNRAWAASKQTNDATWVPQLKPGKASGMNTPTGERLTTFEVQELGESAGYFNRRAWNIALCGRCAVGVGVGKSDERVFRAACQDRLCPRCQARSNAHGAAAIGKLLRHQLEEGQRVFFWTLTIQHGLEDSFKLVHEKLNRAWQLFIRRKQVKETWAERLRVAEVEFTTNGGWHLHFHGLCNLQEGSTAPALDVQQRMKGQWKDVTARQGRLSHQVDFRELRIHQRCSETNEITHLRYWLTPDQHKYALRMEQAGKWMLWRNGRQLYRVQTFGAIVSELTKYVTKRHADGVKKNQLPLFEWSPKMLHEYALGVKGWNLRRASKGWAEVLQDFEEAEILQREIEQAKGEGYDYYSWAEIVDDCRRAAARQLTGQEADEFAAVYPRILGALDTAGCDISADQIRGYVLRFFGDTGAELKPLKLTAWERAQARDDYHAQTMESQDGHGLRARHFRLLLHVMRAEDKGRSMRKLGRLGMSRERRERTLAELQAQNLLRDSDDGLGITTTGRAVVSACSSRRLAPDKPKPERAKDRARRLAFMET